MMILSVAALVLAAAGIWFATKQKPTTRVLPALPIGPPTAAPATAPADLPTPEIGVDAKQPTAVPAPPTSVPTAAPATEPTKPPPPRRFMVQFSSIPPSTLYVDGRLIGPSVPAQRVELEEGTHRYRFEASGLPTHEQTLRVGPNGAAPIAYQFPIGSLMLQTDTSWIGASIIVDGKYKATVQSGTERVRLPPGLHRVIVLREGFHPANREITIEKGAEVNWSPGPAVPLDAGG